MTIVKNPLIKANEVLNLVDWSPSPPYCDYFYAEDDEVVFIAHVCRSTYEC